MAVVELSREELRRQKRACETQYFQLLEKAGYIALKLVTKYQFEDVYKSRDAIQTMCEIIQEAGYLRTKFDDDRKLHRIDLLHHIALVFLHSEDRKIAKAIDFSAVMHYDDQRGFVQHIKLNSEYYSIHLQDLISWYYGEHFLYNKCVHHMNLKAMAPVNAVALKLKATAFTGAIATGAIAGEILPLLFAMEYIKYVPRCNTSQQPLLNRSLDLGVSWQLESIGEVTPPDQLDDTHFARFPRAKCVSSS